MPEVETATLLEALLLPSRGKGLFYIPISCILLYILIRYSSVTVTSLLVLFFWGIHCAWPGWCASGKTPSFVGTQGSLRTNVKCRTWLACILGWGLTVWGAALWIWGLGERQAEHEPAIGPSSKGQQEYSGLCEQELVDWGQWLSTSWTTSGILCPVLSPRAPIKYTSNQMFLLSLFLKTDYFCLFSTSHLTESNIH